MDCVSNGALLAAAVPINTPGRLVLAAIVVSAVGIALLLTFILGRRTLRQRYFQQRDARAFALRQDWEGIVSGAVPAEMWRADALDQGIVEDMLLDGIERAHATGPLEEVARLQGVLRSSGLLDARLFEARTYRGWRRRRALVMLGRTRAPETVPALAEALDDKDLETRVAAVRGLGGTGLADAAEQMLDRVVDRGLRTPGLTLQNSLLNCCRGRPELLQPYLRRAEGGAREMLARVLAELATPGAEEEILLLVADPLPEVRASAARALGVARPGSALGALTELARDKEWFVRLRAVVALGALGDARAIPVLIGALCDANRNVRLRSARALAQMGPRLEQIVGEVIDTKDRYALQAIISELERAGGFAKLFNALADPARREGASATLTNALRAGAEQVRSAARTKRKDKPKPEKATS